MTLNNIINRMLFPITILNIDCAQSMNYEQNTYYPIQYQNSTNNLQSPRFQNICNNKYNSNINSKYIFTFKNQSEDDSNNADDIKNNNTDTSYQNNICNTSNNNLSYTHNYLDYTKNYSSIILENNYNNIIRNIALSDDIFMKNTTNIYENNNHINSILNCSIGSRSSPLSIRSRNNRHNDLFSQISSNNNSSLHDKSTIKDNINLCSNIKEELQKFSEDYLFSINDGNLIRKENVNKLRDEINERMNRMLNPKNYDTTPYTKKSNDERIKDLCNNMIDYYNTHQMYIYKNKEQKNQYIIYDIPFTILQIMYRAIKKYEPNIVDEAIKAIYIRNRQQVLQWSK